jgi:hypothetical protein
MMASCEKVASGCWEWRKSTRRNGYGRLWISGKTRDAHRVIYTLISGDPGSLEVCHTCDNRKCINPAHLFPGTHAENVHDAIAKGRFKPADPFGSPPPTNAKLTEQDVRAIKRMLADGEKSGGEIGRQFGVTRAAIHFIGSGRNWGHIQP